VVGNGSAPIPIIETGGFICPGTGALTSA